MLFQSPDIIQNGSKHTTVPQFECACRNTTAAQITQPDSFGEEDRHNPSNCLTESKKKKKVLNLNCNQTIEKVQDSF